MSPVPEGATMPKPWSNKTAVEALRAFSTDIDYAVKMVTRIPSSPSLARVEYGMPPRFVAAEPPRRSARHPVAVR